MKLILVRHGQSTYNLENRFTGWKDVGLTIKGTNEAKKAADILKNNNINIDMAFTSNLKRAQNTLNIILKRMNLKIPIEKDSALNERDYGDLIGQNKAEAAKRFGKEQVQEWRRSYDVPPPGGESLKMTCERTLPYFNRIMSLIKEGKTIIISAHGNSIRSIIMYLFNYDKSEILKTEIGWCEPFIIIFNNKNIINFQVIAREGVKSMSNIPRNPIKLEEI